MPNTNIVNKIWQHCLKHGTGHIGYQPTINFNQGKHFSQGQPVQAVQGPAPPADGVDNYFTPALSTGGRKRGSYRGAPLLWVDCDGDTPLEQLASLHPSYVWETSPRHYHAVWLLDKPLPNVDFTATGLNGVLAKVLHADPSGCDPGQLLRTPGTTNFKRDGYDIALLQATQHVHRIPDLAARIARLAGVPVEDARALARHTPDGRDRSAFIFRVVKTLQSRHLTPPETTSLLQHTCWNKWKTREKLLEDVQRVYSYNTATPAVAGGGAAPPEAYVKPALTVAEPATPEPLKREFLSLLELGEIAASPRRWLVPGLIECGKCGIIAAPPKVGKTRFAMELALGMATGDTAAGYQLPGQIRTAFYSLEDGKDLFARRIYSFIEDAHKKANPYGTIEDLNRYTATWVEGMGDIPFFPTFEPLDLTEPADIAGLERDIQENKFEFVVIDTLSMAIGAKDVNNSSDMYSVLKVLKRLAQKHDCTIMVIHHTRKPATLKKESVQSRILGSTAIHAWADLSFLLDRETINGIEHITVELEDKNQREKYILDDVLTLHKMTDGEG